MKSIKNLRVKILLLLVTGGFCVFNTSCYRHIIETPSLDEVKIYPPPPDTTRIQYLTSITSSKDIVGTQSSFRKFIFGTKDPIEFGKPYGITGSGSTMTICDTGLGGLIFIDFEKGNFDLFKPSGAGQLKLPLACSFDENGYLYVADAGRGQIVVFDKQRKYIDAFGEADNFRPTDLFVFEEHIWVVNVKDHKLLVYDKSNYELVSIIPDLQEGEDGFLFQPTSIFIKQDIVYVTDFGDFKIKKYTTDGVFLGSIGSYGKNLGQVARPKGLSVDEQLNVYVADAAFEVVQVFNKDNQLLMFFGGPYQSKGDMYLPSDVYIDYHNLDYFKPYVNESYDLKFLIFVVNQYGPDKINVYGFVEAGE